MESSSYTSSSSSSSQYPLEVQRSKPSPSFVTSLHGVRKRPAKRMKKPIAPLPPIPPKIYKVEPRNFREVVQKLTGEPEHQLNSLEEVVPPPLILLPVIPQSDILEKLSQPLSAASNEDVHANVNDMMVIETKGKSRMESDTFEEFNPLGFTFSPSYQAWLSSVLLSPGTLSSEEASTVL